MSKEYDMSTAIQNSAASGEHGRKFSHLAVGIDGFDEGHDAAALGHALATAMGAKLLLAGVVLDPLVVLPEEMNLTALRREAEQSVRHARDQLAPEARVTVESDLFVARGLERVVQREHSDLLIVGSSRHGHEGEVMIGRWTRQLLHDAKCALAVAPRGYRRKAPHAITRIIVGYDGGPEAAEALALGAGIAAAARGELVVYGVVDDRARPFGWSRRGTGAAIVPALGWEAIGSARATSDWEKVVESATVALGEHLREATHGLGVSAHAEVRRGRAPTVLMEAGLDADLIIIGSRRWGPVARLLLGSTGEALLHGATCPVLVAPRPPG
jgi:nucleotide-binding universal stress UspA family protein